MPHGAPESFSVDFVTLVESYARHLGEQVPLSFRMDLCRLDAARPLAAFDAERHGTFVTATMGRVRGSRTVRRFVPVSGEIPAAPDVDSLREIAQLASQDALHHFGVDGMSLFVK